MTGGTLPRGGTGPAAWSGSACAIHVGRGRPAMPRLSPVAYRPSV